MSKRSRKNITFCDISSSDDDFYIESSDNDEVMENSVSDSGSEVQNVLYENSSVVSTFLVITKMKVNNKETKEMKQMSISRGGTS